MATDTRRNNGVWAFANCQVCGAEFLYSRTLKEPPKTCGMLACGRKAGEGWAK